ncbi:hypothetical protein EMCG_03075 [[Emmonsia] crescens]|uniref:Uncharacterized protein n=1 Tax=[Emmonsia] crescens TaxID=73230 RepID=A0A0G2J0Q0_9EURO|nr:hypothetical protein EMCG_03075 [Emmonsia crescens UAMH 3008]
MLTFSETTGLVILLLVLLQHPVMLIWTRRLFPWLWPQSESDAVLLEIRAAVTGIDARVQVLKETVTRFEQRSNSVVSNTQPTISSPAAVAVAPRGSEPA